MYPATLHHTISLGQYLYDLMVSSDQYYMPQAIHDQNTCGFVKNK